MRHDAGCCGCMDEVDFMDKVDKRHQLELAGGNGIAQRLAEPGCYPPDGFFPMRFSVIHPDMPQTSAHDADI